MSETKITSCDLCGEIFEPEMCIGSQLSYRQEDGSYEYTDICKKCFKAKIKPMKR